jgi:cyanophycin synthetase
MTKNFKYILEEARALGLSIDLIYPEKEVAEISDGTKSIIVKELFSIADDPSSESAVLAKNKEITYRFWERAHIPFPRSRYFKNTVSFPKNEADLNLKFPVVFKRSNGKRSKGIHTNIVSFQDLATIVAGSDDSFIIQEMVFGKEYRLLIYGDRLLGALELVPPQITGNGRDSITTLIEKKNARLGNKVIINKKVIDTLIRSGFSLEDIPKQGQCVPLQENSCLAEGGSSIDCTDAVHENMRKLAIRSARVVNMRLAGVDIICEDISIDPDKQKVSFLETNNFPSLSIHYSPSIGKPRRVAKEILKGIFDRQARD